jgi:hypothetical protein
MTKRMRRKMTEQEYTLKEILEDTRAEMRSLNINMQKFMEKNDTEHKTFTDKIYEMRYSVVIAVIVGLGGIAGIIITLVKAVK